MKKISSLTFFEKWLETVKNRKEQLLQNWQEPTIFTSHITGNDTSIMKEIATKLDLRCYPYEYYSIDTILYKEEDKVPLKEGQYCFRDIRVAFEHENHFNSGLYKEISHLLITNCDLRVLVTYPPNDNKENIELKFWHTLICGHRQSKEISDDENFLVILGYENGFQWEGFVYKEDKWKQINIDN
ncbi:MAG: hypothetical protein K8R85_09325 [Bacteroidetes bacterium]|nr:hypothetical protein [Bacteroidota bacterium]